MGNLNLVMADSCVSKELPGNGSSILQGGMTPVNEQANCSIIYLMAYFFIVWNYAIAYF
jgi:hypothetical protein